jgi:hypothetical protein
MDLDAPILRSEGSTLTEKVLKNLCEHSFLSRWSYAGVFRDQGKAGKGDGKEVCDVLIVFGNDIIIFSDKSCLFPECVDEQLGWKRWFRRSIWESAGQAWGAERWIRAHPERLFLDRACTQRFPLALPKIPDVRFHHVVVTHGLAQQHKTEIPENGSLRIDSRLIGGDDHAARIGPCLPFTIGWLDPDHSFVHVLGDASLQIVLNKLDTIRDFTAYLSRKEKLFREGHLIAAASEQDLLAVYLRQLDESGEHDFVFPGRPGPLVVPLGEWERFADSSERKMQIKANKISEGWDWIIENFTTHIFRGTAHYSSFETLANREKAFRVMASEGRVRRRLLVSKLWGLMEELGEASSRVRVVLPSNECNPCYVFLLMRPKPQDSYDEYRDRRAKLLEAYCRVTKIKFPNAREVIGLAMEPFDCEEASQDALYLNAREWTRSDQAHAEELHSKLGLLSKVRMGADTIYEYPMSSDEFIEI